MRANIGCTRNSKVALTSTVSVNRTTMARLSVPEGWIVRAGEGSMPGNGFFPRTGSL